MLCLVAFTEEERFGIEEPQRKALGKEVRWINLTELLSGEALAGDGVAALSQFLFLSPKFCKINGHLFELLEIARKGNVQIVTDDAGVLSFFREYGIAPLDILSFYEVLSELYRLCTEAQEATQIKTSSKPVRVLFFYDEEGWAWYNKAGVISELCSDKFVIERQKFYTSFNVDEYDLFVLFDPYPLRDGPWSVPGAFPVPPEKLVVGCSCPIYLHETERVVRSGRARAGFVNNLGAFNNLQSKQDFFLTQNGVDHDLFQPTRYRPEELIACWVGNSKSVGNKGLDIIQEACRLTQTPLNFLDRYAVTQKSELLSQEQVRDRFYHRSSVYVCASEFEGTPNPALEALSCGLPVISTAVGNMPELLEEGENGFIVGRDVYSVATALKRLKGLDIEKMRYAARHSIVEGWTWEHQVKKYEHMFRTLAGND